MGKFPGKSYKTVNRKRINVGLSECVALPENECLQAAKNVCLGLAVFRDLFGNDDDQVDADFQGFSAQDVRISAEDAEFTHKLVKAQLEGKDFDDIAKHKSIEEALDLFLLSDETSTVQNTIKPPSATRTRRRPRPSVHSASDPTQDNSIPSSNSNLHTEPVCETLSLKITAQKLLQRAKKSSTNVSTSVLHSPSIQEKVSNGAIRKFVLPCRSVRSSRVIKPSKRVMESEEVLRGTIVKDSSCDIKLKKPKLTRASRSKPVEPNIVDACTKIDDSIDSDYASQELPGNLTFNDSTEILKQVNEGEKSLIVEGKRRWKPTYKVQLKLRELNVFGAGTSRLSSSHLPGSRSNSSRSEQYQTSSISSASSDTNERTNEDSEESNSHWPSPSATGGKVILRKARLKLATPTYPGSEGSFSAGFSANASLGNFTPPKSKISMPGTVECGVCGAVRFYKFVKQARKFGVFCCESCRKFVAKMIKKQEENRQILVCHRGEGMCKSIPIVRSQQWKTGQNISGQRCLYKSRCPACWLKLCLRYFNMPDNLRQKLIELLPVSMRQGIAAVPLNDPMKIRLVEDEEFLASQSTAETLKPKDSKSDSKVNIRPNKREIKAASRYLPDEEKNTAKPKEINLNQKIIKKASKNLVKSSLKRSGKKKERKGTDGSRRQKLDLKGPRVKHVCRSASVVLGQPQATFPNIGIEKVQLKEASPLVTKPTKASCSPNSVVIASELKTVMEVDTKKSSTVVTTDVPKMPLGVDTVVDVPCSSVLRKPPKLPPPPLVKTMQVLPGKLPSLEQKSLVSIDFWESYDPEEVCNTGFGLIGSEPFHARAMCFLCGSAGLEKLIHCASCCEPFHRFCLYDGLRDATMSLMNSKDEWRLDWICQRCKVCHSCGNGSGQQLSCQRCRRTYHTSCLGNGISRLHSPDRPWVCSACLRCNSCGLTNVTQFVGNLPFCDTCFRLRKKGNYCPLCQKCYEDDDYDSKMMECGRCKCWVHAKCEGVSDEKYQVLSFLPESVEFVCRNCCVVGPWRASVEDALKSGYTAVIKALSKNRKARALLKYSPKKSCLCRAPITKRISFPDLDEPESTKVDVINNVPVEEDVTKEESSDLPLLQLSGKTLVISLVKVNVTNTATELACIEKTDLPKPIELEASLKEKFNIRDCSVCVGKLDEPSKETTAEDGCVESLDSTFSDCSAGKSPPKLSLLAATPSDSGIGSADDELKASSDEVVIEPVRVYAPSTGMDYTSNASEEGCLCVEPFRSLPTLTLLDIKKKVDNCEYLSLLEFNQEMEHILMLAGSETEELMAAYHHSLKDLFPWFDPKLDQVSVSSRPREELPEKSGDVIEQEAVMDIVSDLILPEFAAGKSLEYYYSGLTMDDLRVCGLCKGIGDGKPADEGRLLYCGQNEWTHSNCALWSSEVFEEIDGSLQNVHSAVFRGRKITCELCGKKGASVGCCSRNCFNTYHFPCARLNGSVFMEDKNVFCPLHTSDAFGKALHRTEEFDLRRPIYVELDRKKKKYVEPRQVKFMIGSLYVEGLGVFVSGSSDSIDAIIPAEFNCTRLYWSTTEPWRIVQYTMKTISPLNDCKPSVDLGRNITISHDQDESVVKQELEDLAEWYRRLSRSTSEEPSQDIMDQQAEIDKKVIQERMDFMLDTIVSREAEENAADILPPELKDAIFEDLPHDLLDGISMQDILDPKLMNYEDFTSMDLKDSCYSSDVDGNSEGKELSEEAMLNAEVERNTKNQEERNLMEDLWFGDSKDNVQDIVEGIIQSVPEIETVVKGVRELKRSKSEVIPQPVRRSAATRGQQRSCSLTWSCTVDSTKRRKVQSRSTRSGDNLITIDVTAEHKLHELRLPEGVLATLARSSSPTSLTSEDSDLKEPPSARHREEEGKENKFWHGRQRLLQVDGAIDSSCSSSEAGSPPPPDLDQDLEKPVKCSRCHRTYRTRVSYERHLPTCSSEFILSTSESDSETRSSEGDNTKKTADPSEYAAHENMANVVIKTEPDIMVPVTIIKNEYDPNVIACNISLPMEQMTSIPFTASPPQQIQNMIVQSKTYSRAPCPRVQTSARRGRPPKVKSTQDIQPMKVQHPNILCNTNMTPMLSHSMIPQQPVIMQQVPQMPTFIEQFQQQSGQSLQYIATIDVQNNAFKPQYLANGIVPGTYQLQSAPESYVGLQNGNVVLPNVQLGPSQPMLGTIIQQPTTSIQCGLMRQEQMMLNGAPLEMYQDQSGGMFISSPQVYYGLETIVSNTVMSSSQVMSSNQFLPGMQGMVAASSSYSATTTQVYQTNKLDSRIDLPTSYVIMPNNTQMNHGMSNQIPISLQATPTVSVTRPQNTVACSWSLNTSNTFVPSRAAQLPAPKPKPCYMPKCPPPASFRQYPSPVSSNINQVKGFPQVKHLSFKSSKVHIPIPVMQSQNNSIRQQLPQKKLEPKPMLKGNADLNRWQQSIETHRANSENQPSAPVFATTEKPVNQVASPVKLVIHKSEKNGFYKITQQTIPTARSLIRGTEQKPKEATVNNNKVCIPAIILVDKSPLADKIKVNQSNNPVKKRWVPKESVKILPKVVTPSKLMYQVQSQDGFSCTSASVSEVWEKVFEAVQKARVYHKMSPLTKNPFGANIGGLQMLGLSHNGLRYLTEQLNGVNRCVNYKPRYHQLARPTDEDTETAPVVNPTGCSRSEPFIDRSPYDLFSWLASRHRKPPKLVTVAEDTVGGNNRRATSSNLPMAMRFRHLKETSKEAVGVYRSHIHGRGLFCLRDIESGEMVVEYAGEVIRSTLTDYREKLYDRKDIGCYMFRIDDQLVVDATMRGNAARFINHSCEPNCYSKVVDILGKKHILIFALRRIPQGEELTYDYKFPFEDIKIPCTCGSRRCRKHLN